MPLLFLAILIAIALLAIALRGRRIDDHPLCRKCKFDLTGKPDTSTRCPECGADLTRPHATRVGHRKIRPRLASVAVSIFVACVFLAPFASAPAIYTRSLPYQPLFLLRLQARMGPSKGLDALAAELTRRVNAGAL